MFLRLHEREMGRSSGWMFLDAANDLFVHAKQRVFGDLKNPVNKSDLLNKKHLYAKENKEMVARVINESPKLNALNEILIEIIDDLKKPENHYAKINLLLAANDDRTCFQIKQVRFSLSSTFRFDLFDLNVFYFSF